MADDQDKGSHDTGYPAEKARQGRIALRAPWQRWVFFGGLAIVAILAILVRAFWH